MIYFGTSNGPYHSPSQSLMFFVTVRAAGSGECTAITVAYMLLNEPKTHAGHGLPMLKSPGSRYQYQPGDEGLSEVHVIGGDQEGILKGKRESRPLPPSAEILGNLAPIGG